MCDPILVPLLKMRPHYSQSSSEMRPRPAAHPHKSLISLLLGSTPLPVSPPVEERRMY